MSATLEQIEEGRRKNKWARKNWDSIQDRRRADDDEPLNGRA